MATVQILTIPIGSQLTSIIQSGESADKNDFTVLLIFSQNVTGLTLADLSVSAGSLVSLTGKNAVYAVRVRPPTTSTVLTFTVAANAVTEGNSATSQNIRVSTSFPDVDAEAPTQLFAVSFADVWGVVADANRIRILRVTNTGYRSISFWHYAYTYAGIEHVSERVGRNVSAFLPFVADIDFINGDFLVANSGQNNQNRVYRYNSSNLEQEARFIGGHGITHTPFGYITKDLSTFQFLVRGYDGTTKTYPNEGGYFNRIAYSDGFLFTSAGVYSISDSAISFEKRINIRVGNYPLFIFQDKIYTRISGGVGTLDIRKYRPLRKNTKTTIPVQFATVGDKIDLTQFAPDAEKFTFAVGFDKPSYLSINASNELVVDSGGDVVLVKLTGINRIDSIDLEFYLVILQDAAPAWRDVSELTMRAGSTYNLFQIVPDADSITFKIGETQPTGASLSTGSLTIGTTSGTVYLTATKGGLSAHKNIHINILQPSNPDHYSDVFRYKVEIAGIDITDDLINGRPRTIAKSIDDIELTKYRAHTLTIALHDPNGKYAPNTDNNFWTTHSLNPGGYQEPVTIRLESFVNGAWVSTIVFIGRIQTHAEIISAVQTNLRIVDISIDLETQGIQDLGNNTKWAVLRPQSDEAIFESTYVPEAGLTPMQVSPITSKAYHDRTQLTLRQLQNPTHGPELPNTGYLTPTAFQKSGSFLEELPLLKFTATPRNQSVQSLIKQLAVNKSVYNTDIQLPEITLDTPTFFNLGSISFEVEDTRITRLPVDWVFDTTADRKLILLSNPEMHIRDAVLEIGQITGTAAQTYRLLHELPEGTKAHRIARKDTHTYAILTSGGIKRDGSRSPLPRPSDADAYASDAVAEGADIKILLYTPDELYPLVYQRQVALQSGNTAPHGATQVGDAYWVASNNDDNVYVYTHDWTYQERFALPSGNTQPRGLALHTKRDLVISVDNARKLFLINPTTRALVSEHTLQQNPEGVLYFETIDEIWVISHSNRQITRYHGTTVTYLGSFTLDSQNGDARGGTYLASIQRAAVLDATDKVLYLYDANGTPDSVTVPLSATQQTVRAVMETDTGIVALDNGNDSAWIYEKTPFSTWVDKTDTQKPQLGIHYWIGFENKLYIDEFEGICPDYRGAFKVVGSDLYYRYAKDGAFGVARVNTGGTTREMIKATYMGYWNHLNFAFDVTTTGTVYFVYVTAEDEYTSTLVIKRRTSGGTETTILEDIQALGEGIYLGAYEALFHNNYLYILVPIGRVDLGADARDTAADPDFIIEIEDTGKSGERYVTTTTNLNPSNTRLAPSDDIPIRIDFNGSVSGATADDLTVFGGTIKPNTFAISSDMIDVTIVPDDLTVHKSLVIDLAEDAVDQQNEATRIIVDFGTQRSQTKSAGMALYRCNVTANSPSLEVLETYDFVQRGACNLIVHDGAVHFVEHPPAATKFKPINPDLDGYWTDAAETQTMGYNLISETPGALKKVNTSGNVQSLGNLWYDSGHGYNQAQTRALSIDNELHIVMGYSNPNEVLRYNARAAGPDNFVHLIYGRKLCYILPSVSTDMNIYAALATLANQVGAILNFENQIIFFTDRRPYRAKTNGATGTGTANIAFDSANKPLPTSGNLRIGDEVLQYTGISSGAFTGITRGLLQSTVRSHADTADILYLHAILSESDILEMNLSLDIAKHFNVIQDTNSNVEVRDAANIRQYNEQVYPLNLGLTRNENVWIETIFEEFLSEHKNLEMLLALKLPIQKKAQTLQLGDIVGIRYAGRLYTARFIAITETEEILDIKARTVSVSP